ncbi:MAG: carboxypeptidase M32 [Planctomycetaceae bacterium]|nr:carboxypeptidase M32 [Planctomycetaceae bacterium]
MSTATIRDSYQRLVELTRRRALLSSCTSVLSWDRETYMPDGGTEHRANQLSLLAGLTHEWATASELGDLLASAQECGAGQLTDDEMANVREISRAYQRATCLPQRLVEEQARVAALAQQHWAAARRSSRFGDFAPWLEQMVHLKREEAAAVGFERGGEPYDALLDEYEQGARSENIASVFDRLRAELVPLLSAIQDSSSRPDASILHRHYPVDIQNQFCRQAASAIGFDFDSGRLDVTTHPFCSGFGPGDCRLTTRFDESHFSSAFFGTLHEAGHGIYEQGLPVAAFGTPLGTAASLGIHESQSRMWENLVGRSRGFWQHFYPIALQRFPDALSDVPESRFHAAINAVAPSFIRVEADEVTYNLHIMLRFDLERELIAGRLQPQDVPAAWNDRFTSDFGITPPNDSQGCLQDIHWSAGLFGYFPTYTLGNLYAAQLFDTAEQAVGPLDEHFARGEFRPLLDWLRSNVHQHGHRFPPAELIKHVTGSPPSDESLLQHLHRRFRPLYQLT